MRALSTSSGYAASNAEPLDIQGSTTPRLWTPPLRQLDESTSYGFDVIWFAENVLKMPLDPWQQWLVIRLGELLADGRPRFRIALVLVARQQGKSHLARVLTLYWMFVERVGLVLGLNATLGYAKEQWKMVCQTAQTNRWLADELGPNPIRLQVGEECLTTRYGSRYKIAAANRRAGRSLTIDRIISDELREQSTWDAWNASYNAMNARPNGQVVAITNQGDDSSVVLDALRGPAIAYIETGEGDPRLGIFEWSAPPGADPTDLLALAQSCPDLGNRTDPIALLGAAQRAKAAGGMELASFRTEVMCQRVALLDPAVDPMLWEGQAGDVPDLAQHRNKVALCLDVSLDGSHATLIAAAELDGRVYADVVKAWSGFGCTKALREELPLLVAKVRPRVVGWFPMGPAAALTADLIERKSDRWPPRRVKLQEIRAEVQAVCMALPDLVRAGEVVHPGDPMLDAHVASAQKLNRGDGWVFTRRGTGPVDGVYALAGAVHLARTLPPPPAPLVVL
jgi:hypothetical protein